MNFWWTIYAGILFLSLVGLLVWFLIVKFREKEEDFDKNIILNFYSNKSNKRFLGVVNDIKYGKNSRAIITYSPRDIVIKKNEDKEIKDETIITDKEFIIPKNTLSKEKNLVFVLPPRIEDLDKNFKETDLGKSFMFLLELENLKKTQIDILREGTLRRDELLKKIGDGEISKEFMNFTEDIVKEALIKMISKEEKKPTEFGVGKTY